MKPRKPGREGLLGIALAICLIAGGPGQAQQDSLNEAARDAVGLLEDNQDRCLKLSYGKLDILEEDYGSTARNVEIDHYLRDQNRTSVRVAGQAVKIVRRLNKRLEGGGHPGLSKAVGGMLRSQADLCEWATGSHSWSSASVYREQIREEVARFAQAQSRLPGAFQLTESQRREVVQKYRRELYGARGDLSDDAIASAMEEDRDLPSERPISAEEYERKKREYGEWLAEQERREAEKVRQQAQRRAAIEARKKQAPREMPKVELKVPDKVPEEQKAAPRPAAEPEAMALWHGEYSARIVPFKRSLSEYLKAQSPSRNLLMTRACQDLSRRAKDVLEDPVALEAPDQLVGKVLRDALTHFKYASDSCLSDRLQKAREHVAKGERSLGRAMQALKPYGLGL